MCTKAAVYSKSSHKKWRKFKIHFDFYGFETVVVWILYCNTWSWADTSVWCLWLESVLVWTQLLGWLPIDSCLALISIFIFRLSFPLWPFRDDHLSQLYESSFYRHPTDLECIVWRVCLTHSAEGKQTATLCVRQKTINPLW